MKIKNKKEVISWAIYDWANSAFSTTVMAGFFPIFFKQYWSIGIDTVTGTAVLAFGNSIAGISLAIFAPLLGAIADRGSAKKKFLISFAFIGIITTSALFFVSQGNWLLALIFFIFANIGFSGGNIFYDSLIKSVATDENADFISSLGYSLGYLGGGILFAINVWMTLSPETFGIHNAAEAIKISFLSVGIWWTIFSIPILIFVKEPIIYKKTSNINAIKEGLIQFRNTFKQIRHLKMIFLFLISYWFYIDGVDTIISMAIDYGVSIGFEPKDLIIALLITQFVGFPAAIVFGYIGEKIGAKQAIFIAISVYLFVSIWSAFMQHKNEFYILAIVIGLVQGGIQALSRSFFAKIIPSDKSAEFFGFYNMIGRFATILGPILIGGTGLIVRSLGYSNNIASRVGISSVSILFIIGGSTLFFVDEKEGKKEAEYLE